MMFKTAVPLLVLLCSSDAFTTNHPSMIHSHKNNDNLMQNQYYQVESTIRKSCLSLNAKSKGGLRKILGKIASAAIVGGGLVVSYTADPKVAWAEDTGAVAIDESIATDSDAPTAVEKGAVEVSVVKKEPSKSTSIQTKRKLSSMFPSLTNLVVPTASQSTEAKLNMPVFTVCTAWGSPYMVYDDTGAPNALYFLDEDDAKAMLDEFLNMKDERDARIMSTSFSRAMRQAANINGVPTGQLTVDGAIQLMYYKIVPSTKELFYASKLSGRENLAMTGVEDEFIIQERIVGSVKDDEKSKDAGDPMMPARLTANDSSVKELRQKAKKRAGPFRKRHGEILQEKNMMGREGIPAFFVEGMQFQAKNSFIPGRQKSLDTPMFLSYNDCVNAWKEMRNKLSPEEKAKIPLSPKVEVFNLVDVVASIDKDTIRRKSSKDEYKTKSGLESIVFVPSSKSIKFVEGITARGNGKARLPDMR